MRRALAIYSLFSSVLICLAVSLQMLACRCLCRQRGGNLGFNAQFVTTYVSVSRCRRLRHPRTNDKDLQLGVLLKKFCVHLQAHTLALWLQTAFLKAR